MGSGSLVKPALTHRWAVSAAGVLGWLTWVLAAAGGAADRWSARGWITDFETGVAEAARRGRPAFVYFDAPWCSWCQQYERDTLTRPRIARILAERYVPVVVDFDARSDLAERFGARGLPFTVMLSARGEVLNAFVGILTEPDLADLLEELARRPVARPGPELRETIAVAGGAGLDHYRDFRRAWLEHVEGLYDPKLGTLAGRYATGAGLKRPSPLTWMYLERHRLWSDRAARAARLERERLQDPADGGFFNFLDPHREDEYAETSKLLEANAWLIAWQAHRAFDPAARDGARRAIGYLARRLWNPAGGFWQAQVAVPGYRGLAVAERRRNPPPVLRIQRADTNAQAAWALGQAAWLLRDREALGLARRALDFVLGELWRDGTLYHFRRNGRYVLRDHPDDSLWTLAAGACLQELGVPLRYGERLDGVAARLRRRLGAATAAGATWPVQRLGLLAWVAQQGRWRMEARVTERALAGLRIESDTPPDDVVLGLQAWERYLFGTGGNCL